MMDALQKKISVGHPGRSPRDSRITVIIITAFRVEWLTKCLRALVPQLKAGDEVLVVTGSALSEEYALINEFSLLRVIPSDRLCMPYQRNLGIVAARNDIVAFIDDDVVVGKAWRESVSELYSDPSVDAVVGREVLEGYEGHKSQAVPRLTRAGIRGSMQHYAGQDIREVRGGQGCNMSFRRSVIERIDGFDPNFIVKAYGEESDVFERIQAIGARVMFHPGMDVLHCPAQTREYGRGPFDLRGTYYVHRNFGYLYAKHFLFGSQYACHVACVTCGYFVRCAKRIMVITAHTAAAFVLSLAGTFWGTVEGIKWRLRGRRQKYGGIGSLVAAAKAQQVAQVGIGRLEDGEKHADTAHQFE
jgi:GT2 family glycosyltransferase